jgi:Domain of Unknown Function (DUF928)
MNHLWKRQLGRYALMVSLIFSVSFWMGPVAVADYRPPTKPSAPKGRGTNTSRYRPPSKPSAPKGTGTNTTRGGSCDRTTDVGLTTLVPFSHIGQTGSQHPTFTWFVPDRAAHPLQFRLFTRTGQPLYRTEMQSQSGIMSVALPPKLPPLAIGQTYQWQVVLVCAPTVPSRNVVATAEIQVVKPAASLQAQLAAAPTPQQRLDLYAESGLWYDALAEAVKVSQTTQNSSSLLELLDALAASEAQPLKDWSDRLKQIQTIERQRQSR